MAVNTLTVIRKYENDMIEICNAPEVFTSRSINVLSGHLTRFSNRGLITKIGFKHSVVHYKLSSVQKQLIQEKLKIIQRGKRDVQSLRANCNVAVNVVDIS